MVQDDFLYKVSGVGGEVIEWSLDKGPVLRPASRYSGRALTSVQEQNLSLRGNEYHRWRRGAGRLSVQGTRSRGKSIEWSLDTCPLLLPGIVTGADQEVSKRKVADV